MSVIWVEDNFPGIRDILDKFNDEVTVSVEEFYHVQDAYQALKSGRDFSLYILDIMLPLGGGSIPSDLTRYRNKFALQENTEFSGVILGNWILDKYPDSTVIFLSDFAEKAIPLTKEHKHAHCFHKYDIDENIDLFFGIAKSAIGENG